jgi:hypothetical protein
MRGHAETPLILHLTIPISLLVFQAVRNERAPWLSCQMQFLTTSKHKVAGSNPTSATAKKPVVYHPNKFLGVVQKFHTRWTHVYTIPAGIAQRQSVYNIVGHILDSSESERLMVIAL